MKYFTNKLTGTTIKNLSLQTLRNTPIPFPPNKLEQNRIATVLSTLDECIEKTEVFIAKLKQNLLTRIIDDEGRIRDESTHEFKDTEIGQVPVEWAVITCCEVMTLKRGYDLPERLRNDGYIPIYSSSGVIGYHNRLMVKGPRIVNGRYETLGDEYLIDTDFWPLNTTLYITDFKDNDPTFLSILLKISLISYQSETNTIPRMNRISIINHIYYYLLFLNKNELFPPFK